MICSTSKVVFSDTFIEIFGCRVLFCPGILEQSMGARNQVGIGLLYRPARLPRMAELILWNRFLGSLKVKISGSGRVILEAPVYRQLFSIFYLSVSAQYFPYRRLMDKDIITIFNTFMYL